MRIRLYSFVIVLKSFEEGLLLPVLSLLLLDKGASLSSLSILMGIYSFTIIILELPTGIMADLLGNKTTFCISLVMSIVSVTLILFSHNYFFLCTGLICYGISRSLSSGSFEALFINNHVKSLGFSKLSDITTRLTVLDAFGLSIGALAGGYLPEHFVPILHFYSPYDINLLLKIALTFVLFILTVIFIEDTAIQKEKPVSLKSHIKNSWTFIYNNKMVLFLFISVFSTGYFLNALETYWQPHFMTLITGNKMMFLLGIIAFLYLASTMAGGVLSNKLLLHFQFRPHKMYFILRLLTGAALFATALQSNVSYFVVFYSLTYLIFGMANIPESVLLNGETPNELRASVLSMNSLAAHGGGLLSSCLSSIFINYFTIPNLWIISAVIIIMSVIPMYTQNLKQLNRKESKAN